MPDNIPLFLYTVAVHEDGSLIVDPNQPESLPRVRVATVQDILNSARRLVADLDRRVMVDEIVTALAPQSVPEASDQIREALKERGITPETTASDTSE